MTAAMWHGTSLKNTGINKRPQRHLTGHNPRRNKPKLIYDNLSDKPSLRPDIGYIATAMLFIFVPRIAK
jgi:hypothetical protein